MSTGSKALDRPVQQWLTDIAAGRLHLPSFQRGEAWDRKRIESMLRTIIRDLPLGITLVLDVGGKEQFHSRPLKTAPATSEKVTEHLLDGQQRLTALWRSLKDNYEDRTFFVHHPLLDEDPQNDGDDIDIWSFSTWKNKAGQLMPRWTQDPTQCAKRGLVPVSLLDPSDESEAAAWVDAATLHLKPILKPDSDPVQIFAAMEAYEARRGFLKSSVLSPLRETVKHYRLPYLSLPASTPKSVALEVFINMNTNAKPLRPFDIVVAEVENATEARLQEMIDAFIEEHPHVRSFGAVSELLLQTIALHQDLPPNKTGFYSLDAHRLVAEWDICLQGLRAAIELLSQMRIWDSERLPTAVAVPVVAAMLIRAPKHGDARGLVDHVSRKYLWTAYFTGRYDGAAASRAHADAKPLLNFASTPTKDSLEQLATTVPVFDREVYPLPGMRALQAAAWPTGRSSLARAVLAASNSFGARDFADDSPLSPSNVRTREYHHLFPAKLLSDAGIDPNLALNCALITWRTNRTIGRLDPIAYLTARAEAAPAPESIEARLKSHLIPVAALREAGPYDPDLTGTALRDGVGPDFERFIWERAEAVSRAMLELCDGEVPELASVLR
ncbi:MAG: GmrSD restriction endonuclease domain-containing protein [Actinomycetota bacterium]